MMGGKPNTLSPKDNALFKSVVKFYTTKQYKKGLKAADAILKSNPNHGETLAMKGLILNCQDKKTEAYDYVRRGLKADLTSHVCWHTYGLLYRSDRNYTEAIKCYLNALRHDKDNLQILRDLSLLQVQMRDLQGYYDTRRKLLTLKPQQGNNWLAFGMSAHLLGYHDEAAMIIDLYDKTKKIEDKFEYSEMLLYKNMIIEESGKYAAALEHLHAVEHHVVDKLAWKEKRAQLLNLVGRYGDSESAYRTLIQNNPENQSYHKGIIAAKLAVPIAGRYEQLCQNLTEEQISTLESLYNELNKEHPRSLFVRRVPLEFLHGERFRTAFAKYICPNLRKGVPSLFTGLKALYTDKEKMAAISNFLTVAVDSLTTANTFPVGEDGCKDTPAEKEPPSSLLWTLYFAAQHYDKLHDHKKAIEQIERALAHTPTVIELYTLKAKVLKHAGDPTAAWSTYEKGRELDLADRYLNTKATLYALRANKVDVAEHTIALFTKEGADSQDVLYDMQCMWYEIESAASYFRTKQYGPCLKKLVAVDKHFADIVEDQFDFHTYCLRKMTLRAYISLLRLEDELYGLKFYVLAAKAIVNTYITIFDHPPTSKQDDSDAKQGMSKEKKKAAKLAAHKEAKKAAAAASTTTATTASATVAAAKPTSTKPADEDPYGEKLSLVADPLAEAYKFLVPLLKYSPDDVEVQLLACKLNLRRRKYLQVIQSLNKANKIAPNHPEVQQHIVELGLAAKDLSGNDTVSSLVQEYSSRLLNGKTPSQVVEVIIANSNASTYSQKIVASKLLLAQDKKSMVLPILENADALQTAQLKEVLAAFELVSSNFASDLVEKFRIAAHLHFPYATAFSPPQTAETTEPPQPTA